MRTFTREELIEAYVQIEREREDELQLAAMASAWLQDKCRAGVTAGQATTWPQNTGPTKAPYLPEYILHITQTQYCHPNAWLRDALSRPTNRNGFRAGEGFCLDLGPAEGFPEGTRYYCAIHHEDAHACGY